MKQSIIVRSLLLCGLVAAAFTGACAQTPATQAAAVPGSAALLAAIQAEVGSAACDSQQQCHSVPLGAKPCGGPDSYLAWSSKVADEKRLTPLLAQYAAARARETRQSGDSSTCMMATDPGAVCQAARCTLRPAGLGSLPASAS